jgi:tRNA (Thr-GGU) A37 N-methylase
VVRLVEIDSNILRIRDIDVVDDTPLLDIKPYVPDFDIKKVDRLGWLSPVAKGVRKAKADERFNRNQP